MTGVGGSTYSIGGNSLSSSAGWGLYGSSDPEVTKFSRHLEDIKRTIEIAVRLKDTPSHPYACDLALQMARQLIDMLLAIAPEDVA